MRGLVGCAMGWNELVEGSWFVRLKPCYVADLTAGGDWSSFDLGLGRGGSRYPNFVRVGYHVDVTKKRVKSIALIAKKESSDDETLTSGSDDEDMLWPENDAEDKTNDETCLMAQSSNEQPREEKKSFRQRDTKKGKSDQKCFRCGDPNHLIGDCPKPPRNKDQKAFIGGSWSDSENDADDKTNAETCLMAQSSNEVCLRTCLEPDEWIKDSGCSKHMTGNKCLFSTYKAYSGGNVVFGSNLKGNIIAKCRVLFTEEGSEIIKDGKIIGNGIRKNGLYAIKLRNKSQDKLCLATVVEGITLPYGIEDLVT
ncbi:retrotransposon protein [Tanacetum coccineum]|uniref:Retrotransposon protein n=1 Tax=Tanacetum coccineum TaxID=301880 RepID=A0ABQ5FI06_9ASTR